MGLMTNRFWYVENEGNKIHTLVGCAERNYEYEGIAELIGIFSAVEKDLDPCNICFSEKQIVLYEEWRE